MELQRTEGPRQRHVGLLTNKDADIDKLLATAETQVNQVLANQ
ncbi:hypothetical protein [Streptomyces sp. Qhu_M48]